MDEEKKAAATTAIQTSEPPMAADGQAEEPKNKGGRPPYKQTLVDPERVESNRVKKVADDAINRIRGEVNRGPVNVTVMPNKLADLLERQASLPPVRGDEADLKTQYPLQFAPEVQQLIDDKIYYCIWVKNPYGEHVTQSDLDLARQVIRALGGGGIYEIMNRTKFDGILPPHLFNSDGAYERMGMLCCYVPYALWDRKREAERRRSENKLKASLEGQDEDGQIPRVKSFTGEAGLPVTIPGQPALRADQWENA